MRRCTKNYSRILLVLLLTFTTLFVFASCSKSNTDTECFQHRFSNGDPHCLYCGELYCEASGSHNYSDGKCLICDKYKCEITENHSYVSSDEGTFCKYCGAEKEAPKFGKIFLFELLLYVVIFVLDFIFILIPLKIFDWICGILTFGSPIGIWIVYGFWYALIAFILAGIVYVIIEKLEEIIFPERDKI